MTTAVVLGATGLVGQELINLLVQEESIETVIMITRRPYSHICEKVENHVIDFEQLDQYETLFQGNLLFSCLGTTKKQAGSISQQRKVDVDYQLQAATIAVKNNIEHYLLVSSSGANVKSSSPYLQMKGELEQSIKALPFAKTTIVQPSLLLGSRTQLRLGEFVASIVMPIFTCLPGLKKYRPIKAHTVAARLVQQALTQPESHKIVRLDEVF
ncbi:NAD(P)H-binding protein [Thalassotalea atypica]|uniref:NAD(P)H-binding protein n=1 Tax=Thalassotalea atypica TaxID=2054316 RepID=UPI0025726104|nr:NAD(P)H-binding protein [Thalassotalea atypica]